MIILNTKKASILIIMLVVVLAFYFFFKPFFAPQSLLANPTRFFTLEQCQKSIVARSDNYVADFSCLTGGSSGDSYQIYYWGRIDDYSDQPEITRIRTQQNRDSIIKLSESLDFCPNTDDNFLVKEKLGACSSSNMINDLPDAVSNTTSGVVDVTSNFFVKIWIYIKSIFGI